MKTLAGVLFCLFASTFAKSHKPKQTRKVLASNPSVTSGGITYQGAVTGQTAHFRRIPYAAPPLNSLRFSPPQSPNLSGTINATTYGPICHQLSDSLAGQSEDCLFLDISLPPGHSITDKIPVLFFIYGGGFTTGFSSQSKYDPTNLLALSVQMKQPIIYVSANYRLFTYGWLGGSNAQSKGDTNVGILDQRMALQWIQNHIADFGGDASKVTLVGQSAGAISASIHLLRDGGNTHGLYRAAILASGTAGSIGVGASSFRQASFNNLAKHCGCSSKADPIACMQNMKTVTEKVLHRAAYSSTYKRQYPFGPQIDGTVVPDSPTTLFSSGQFANVPILAGDVLDEGTYVLGSLGLPKTLNTTDDVLAFLTAAFPGISTATLSATQQLYSTSPSDGSPYNTGSSTFGLGTLGKQAASIYGDIIFQAPRRQFLQAAAGRQPVYAYQFAGKSRGAAGVAHGSDLAYWFGNGGQLGTQMGAAWINFVNTMNPNGAHVPSWPLYSSTGSMLHIANSAAGVVDDSFRSSQINYIIENAKSFFH